jgi:hypothetical protein
MSKIMWNLPADSLSRLAAVKGKQKNEKKEPPR